VPFRIDCGFRNRLLLGLAIWFSKTEPPLVAAATSCYLASRLHPLQPRGPHSLFRTGFSVKRPLPLYFTGSPRRCSVEGARNLLRFRPPCQPPSSTLLFRPSDFRLPVRGGGFYHRRVRCQLRSLTSYFVFHFFSAGASVASATSPFRPRGAASTTTAFGVNTLLRLSSSLRLGPVTVETGASSRGRGLYHRRVWSQHASSTPSSRRLNSPGAVRSA
jgi:hypothetical protein